AGADPKRGRFRDYLKTALRHMAHNHWEAEKRAKVRVPLSEDETQLAAPAESPAESDAAFLTAWREEILARVWDAMQRIEEETGAPCYSLMRLKTEQPHLHSARLAELVAPKLGKVLSEAALLQAVRRARVRFADLLVAEVERTLGTPGPAE